MDPKRMISALISKYARELGGIEATMDFADDDDVLKRLCMVSHKRIKTFLEELQVLGASVDQRENYLDG